MRTNHSYCIKVILIGFISLTLSSCSTFDKKQKKVDFYIYPSGHFKAAKKGYSSLLENFKDIQKHAGTNGKKGQAGIGLVFPYLAWTEGSGTGPYSIEPIIFDYHNLFLKAAKELNMPVLVQFNGAVWHSPQTDSAFLNYWKTVEHGKYLSRYKDGKVNESIEEIGQKIPVSKIKKYLDIGPYDAGKSKDALFFTLSPYAKEFAESRTNTLRNAVKLWKKLDRIHPGVIKSFSTDSEVSNFSFRTKGVNEVPIGYEDWNTLPFCKMNKIDNCKSFFAKSFSYKTKLEQKWFYFRAKNHRRYVQETVNVIREVFKKRDIFTHQIPTLDGEMTSKHKNRDFASPLETGIVRDAKPGYTMYIYGGRDKKFRTILGQVNSRVNGHWGMVEFNPGKDWKGTKSDLRSYTLNILNLAYSKGVRVVCPLAWETNSLDFGIKNSGVDLGIKDFINGKKPK